MTSTTTKLATLDDILACANGNRRFREVTLPVSALTVRIRSLTEREASNYQAHVFSAANQQTRTNRLKAANRLLIALCVVDAEGNRLIPDDRANDIADMDWKDAEHLYAVCAAHSGMSSADVEDLVKNSEPTAPPSSPTS